MTMHFERPMRIRFSHCDPAGIVFFPQYLVMTNALVEDWFNEGLQIDYAQMIGQRRVGLPIVKLDCEFSRPSQMGETIMLTLAVTAIGRRSIGIEIVGHCNGETRFRAKQVLVTTSLESGRSIDIPTDIATALAMFAPQPELSEAQRS
ncbi:1,4-dihydroxy-2-naphthoyl-CoA hydrolase [Paraburkholderia phenoliruptrix]|uniref:1,4-dihydroxy-2-naphthoyl-CoA hydrolase n=1 Tax=Paraburkholderia phenoliruptrix TaxID=252970 RepID=A0A6J4ZZD3_9BURK|nr:thioesterase family protein [Paraburkholderia phenoliruptrix]CAB3647508.1 1,4-dihydroxy-2-naphthoyl-CoA hydrolase [Paraburkholderia phenoliruptrix]